MVLNSLTLGKWVKNQSRLVQGRGGELDDDAAAAKREKRLETMGVKWNKQEIAEERFDGYLICCWCLRSEKKDTCGCQLDTKKVLLIILEAG
jgi:hypothetical protein